MSSNDSLLSPTVQTAYLHQEVVYLHICFFRRNPSSDFIRNYILAHGEIFELKNAPENQLESVRIIIEKRLDAFGIEVWLRQKKVRHILTSKLLLIAYLAECDASHAEFARVVDDGRLRSWLNMTIYGLTGMLRLLRGYAQKKRYGLV